uniref:KIB1-4 beta-propeller domain-containing protein n=1 Tax=Oryza glumipatula TaxID=40148 RepID=A0A0D9YCI9_9ORYZ
MVHLVVVDWIRFGAVCKAWKRAADTASRASAFAPRPSHPGSSDDGDTPQHLAVAGVFSLTDGRRRSITLPAPPIQTRVWIGSANGWVVTADGECELHLLNPISGVQRPLPSITTTGYFDALPRTDGGKATFLWNVASFRDTHRHEGYSLLPGTRSFVEMSAEEIQSSRLLKVVPLFDPSSGKYSIMMMHNPQNKLVFAREGDPKWVPLEHNTDTKM